MVLVTRERDGSDHVCWDQMQTREELIFEQRRSHSVHIIKLKKEPKVSLIRLLSVLAASWNGYLFVYQFDIQKSIFVKKKTITYNG